MQSYWVTVSYDSDVILNNCFTVASRDEAVDRMMNYLHLEFDMPRETAIKVNHH
jgi:hypothetical protein